MSLKKKLVSNQIILGSLYVILITSAIVWLGYEFRTQYSEKIESHANKLSAQRLVQEEERAERIRSFYEETFLDRIKSSLIKDKQILRPYFEENAITNLREYLDSLFYSDPSIYSIQFIIQDDEQVQYWYWTSRDINLDPSKRYSFDSKSESWKYKNDSHLDRNLKNILDSTEVVQQSITIDDEIGIDVSIPIYLDQEKAYLRYYFTQEPLILKLDREENYKREQIEQIALDFGTLKEQLFENLTGYLQQSFIFVGLIALLTILLAGFAAYLLSQQVVKPLENLANFMKLHRPGDGEDQKFLEQSSNSKITEVKLLSESFSELTRTVREKLEDIEKINLELEDTVKIRTAELAESNKALKNTNEELIEAQDQIRSRAHQAGMAEIAIEVIHNIGNVSNTLNIEVHSMRTIIGSLDISRRLKTILELGSDEFIEKLPLVKNYLNEIIEVTDSDITRLSDASTRIEGLNRSIIGTVEAQRRHAIKNDLTEKLLLSEVVTEVFDLQKTKMKNNGIEILLSVDDRTEVFIDRFKFANVIVKLLTNAYDALAGLENPKIQMTVQENGDQTEVYIEDSGFGISEDLQQKIFHFGFTTKSHGTGLGLHSSINSIREIGGNIVVDRSPSLGGARFKVSVPNAKASSDKAS